MHKKIMTKALTGTFIVGAVLASSAQAGTFDNKDVAIGWEFWGGSSLPGTTPLSNGGTLLAVANEEHVLASDQNVPDVTGFHNNRPVGGVDLLWDFDFSGQVIELKYTTIEDAHDFMLMSNQGFHFEDTEDNMPDIVGVTVDGVYAPFGFEAEFVTFDANNIYVNLYGSMCHYSAMGSMPTCINPNSPTGYDNVIKLNVQFVGDAAPISDSRKDAFFNWAEQQYPEVFPGHSESVKVIGYHARHYPETDVYLGTKDGRVYVYGADFGGLLDVGSLEDWLNDLGL